MAKVELRRGRLGGGGGQRGGALAPSRLCAAELMAGFRQNKCRCRCRSPGPLPRLGCGNDFVPMSDTAPTRAEGCGPPHHPPPLPWPPCRGGGGIWGGGCPKGGGGGRLGPSCGPAQSEGDDVWRGGDPLNGLITARPSAPDPTPTARRCGGAPRKGPRGHEGQRTAVRRRARVRHRGRRAPRSPTGRARRQSGWESEGLKQRGT